MVRLVQKPRSNHELNNHMNKLYQEPVMRYGKDQFNWREIQPHVDVGLSTLRAANVTVGHLMDFLVDAGRWDAEERSLWLARVDNALRGDDFIPAYMLRGIKCLGLDIDGCVTAFKSDGTMYKKVLAFLKQWGGYIAFITNQGGPVCRREWGYENFPTIEEVEARMSKVVSQVDPNNERWDVALWVAYAYYHKKTDKWFYPDHIDQNDEEAKEIARFARKPGPGMILGALEHFDVDEDQFLYVGDRDTDEQAAKAAGVHFYMVDMEDEL